jgi:hypothetical protein
LYGCSNLKKGVGVIGASIKNHNKRKNKKDKDKKKMSV